MYPTDRNHSRHCVDYLQTLRYDIDTTSSNVFDTFAGSHLMINNGKHSTALDGTWLQISFQYISENEIR